MFGHATCNVSGSIKSHPFARQDRSDHAATREAVAPVSDWLADSEPARQFLDDRNHKALVGRWVHDPDSGVVALVADVSLAGNLPLSYAVEVVSLGGEPYGCDERDALVYAHAGRLAARRDD